MGASEYSNSHTAILLTEDHGATWSEDRMPHIIILNDVLLCLIQELSLNLL